jgi:hypothetical protein
MTERPDDLPARIGPDAHRFALFWAAQFSAIRLALNGLPLDYHERSTVRPQPFLGIESQGSPGAGPGTVFAFLPGPVG